MMSARDIRAAFDRPAPMTIGIEEELMLLDPHTRDLSPVASELLARLPGDPRYKLELPASQLEIVSPPLNDAAEAARFLSQARADLIAAAGDDIALATAGVHPFASTEGDLNSGERYDTVAREYGRIARRQLVFGLQVHIAVRGADRALAVYNALRSYLPEMVALAANAPFYGGVDSGLATVRPKVNELLPRQGVPPAIESWDAFAEALDWGARTGSVPGPGFWWWELRPHVQHGTLELRVPDAQTTVDDAAGVIAFVHALTRRLAARHDAGDELPSAPTWRIEENRWQALAHGGAGLLADLETGATTKANERLHELVEVIEAGPAARALVDNPGHERQREAHANGGMRGLAGALISGYGAPVPGE
jgi:carboxylate-amine ligase